MPKLKKTAPELARIIEQKLGERGFSVARVTVFFDGQLGWRATAVSAPTAINAVAAAVDDLCRELCGLYDLA